MAFNFNHYIKIKDKYCIGYFGYNAEYIMQLLFLRPYLSEKFKGLQIYLSCLDNLFYLIENEKNTISKTNLFRNKRSFGHIREIKCTPGGEHPIENYLKECEIGCPTICKESNLVTKLCVICNKGVLPNKTLSNENIKYLKSKIENKGFMVKLEENPKNLEGIGWLITIENEYAYLLASKGIKTTLIPTGIGENIFKKMFPAAEVYYQKDIVLNR